jgi:hypothetical protein
VARIKLTQALSVPEALEASFHSRRERFSSCSTPLKAEDFGVNDRVTGARRTLRRWFAGVTAQST